MQGEHYLKAAYAYLYIRDFEHAQEAFEKAIASDPFNALYYFHASITALRSEDFDLAMTWALRAAKLEPDNPMYKQHLDVVMAAIYNRDARTAFLNGDVDEAMKRFKSALELDPLNEEAQQALYSLDESYYKVPDTKQEGTS